MKSFKIPDVAIYGDGVIDQEHQRIVDLVLGLEKFSGECESSALDAYCDSILSEIGSHFVSEETLMVNTEYSGRAQHHIHHVDMTKIANDTLSDIKARGHVTDHDMARFIDDVVRHMLLDDMAFRDYLIEIGHLR